MQRLNRQRRSVPFLRRQTAERFGELIPRQLHRLYDRHSFQHFREDRAASQRRRTSISQKPRRLYPVIAKAQTQAQSIATHRVGFFSDGVGVSEFSAVARIGEMIFEEFGIRQLRYYQGLAVPL